MTKHISPATLAAALQQARGEHLDTGPCTIEQVDAAAIYRLLPDQPDALPTLERLQEAWHREFGGLQEDSDADLARAWRVATSAAAGEGGEG